MTKHIISSRFPKKHSDFKDIHLAIDTFVIEKPTTSFLSRHSIIVTQGSCFALEIYRSFEKNGFNIEYNEFTEAINSPIANEYYFRQIENLPLDPMHIKIKEADIFILTLGVSALWFNKITNEWQNKIDPAQIAEYHMRTISVEEAKKSLAAIYQSLFNINNNIKLVITLSPIPLNLSVEFNSIFIADCLSKSTLRCAIHESLVTLKTTKPVLYFPAFEIVRWLGGYIGYVYGDNKDPSHDKPRAIQPDYVNEIVNAFIRNYLIKDA